MLVKHLAVLEKVLVAGHQLVQRHLSLIHQAGDCCDPISTVSRSAYDQEPQVTQLGEQKSFWRAEQFAGGKCQ